MSIRCRMEKKQENIKLERQDWINAGLKVLAEGGIEAVRVEPLAKLIKVTKGSFYWHFKNRDDLLEAILQEWVKGETNNLIERVETIGGDATTKLLHLFELAIEIDGRLENAIRAWAAKAANVAEIMLQVDQSRLNYTQNLFLQVGFTPLEAKVRAQMAYYSLVGEFTVGTRPNQAERLAEVIFEHAILTRRD
ncbi:transcriptional regulator, TetR family [Trichormus variabilis ATCC 29413]|uniref:Transcriptional regulator, TetR family n=3 Tax=Anabaena variabilis TaxID=264691 RepID=Q3MCR7_TRIV2|nr:MULTISPECIES: TetR/AcrR family transcriptional regulator [Nostocaceae]MBC1217126.1 TetR/AcrR family transcriptional regulator [Trichormus variabilis ARAD]MBC1256698.1 TetR/AcrR family transcriptional regulator [Trichormus variabilis V5]MBC1314090.1 TetR/AcrR family transcriptional regulator [Trichormus variabilis PNB]MBC1329433.1 TetR/AcrR family transcriptional regulator [Trichormus variabilis 9RC]ABA21219.1 transcriptional regulator, TetR family [Trichormus variabilis ATCC 29413]